jgi:hypothetical protein
MVSLTGREVFSLIELIGPSSFTNISLGENQVWQNMEN